jgi:hypothetical protein
MSRSGPAESLSRVTDGTDPSGLDLCDGEPGRVNPGLVDTADSFTLHVTGD